jgi:hypothetical protein
MEISKKIRNMSKTVQSLLPAKFANVLTIFWMQTVEIGLKV